MLYAELGISVHTGFALLVEEHRCLAPGSKGGPVCKTGGIGITCAGKLYIRAEVSILQSLAGKVAVADSHLVDVMECVRNIRAMPCGHTAVVGEIVCEEVAINIGRAFICVLLTELKDIGAVGKSLEDQLVFAGVGCTEEFDDLICFGSVLKMLSDHFNALLYGDRILVGSIGSEAHLGNNSTNHKGHCLCVLGVADIPGITQIPIIGERCPHSHPAVFRKLGRYCVEGFHQLVEGNSFENAYVLAAQLFNEECGDFLIVALAVEHRLAHAAAHKYTSVEKAVRCGSLQKAEHLSAAARLTENSYVIGVAAEGFDIITHPLEGFNYVRLSRVAGIGKTLSVSGKIKVAENIKTVVYGDHNAVTVFTEIIAVVGNHFNGGARGISAAVEPYHNRLLRSLVKGLSPYVEIEAVLTLGPEAVGNEQVKGWRIGAHKRCNMTVPQGILYTLPGLDGSGLLKTLCLGILDTVERVCALQLEASYFSAFGIGNSAGCAAFKLFYHNFLHSAAVRHNLSAIYGAQ